MSERLINWLAAKASDYLIWIAEREIDGAPLCPDCEAPEPICYCEARADADAISQDAYDAGFERGLLEER